MERCSLPSDIVRLFQLFRATRASSVPLPLVSPRPASKPPAIAPPSDRDRQPRPPPSLATLARVPRRPIHRARNPPDRFHPRPTPRASHRGVTASDRRPRAVRDRSSSAIDRAAPASPRPRVVARPRARAATRANISHRRVRRSPSRARRSPRAGAPLTVEEWRRRRPGVFARMRRRVRFVDGS